MPDDKCNRCGDWTQDAADAYDGKYEDGDDLPVCECETGDADDDE
jgi:hypothetical protein